MKKGVLYLFPVDLGDSDLSKVLPDYNKTLILETKHFIVENIRTARRFLKTLDQSIDIDSLQFYTLDKHTDKNHIDSYLKPIELGENIGILSEAGCPAIADPGSDVVAIAQAKDYRVIPLVGPSSILLSLMASGFNGQSFAFLGYLPFKDNERIKAIKDLEYRITREDQTQIFIETPYRNHQLVEDILKHASSNLKLCIALNITCEDEYVKTKSIKDWKVSKLPDMHKKPCIFLLYK